MQDEEGFNSPYSSNLSGMWLNRNACRVGSSSMSLAKQVNVSNGHDHARIKWHFTPKHKSSIDFSTSTDLDLNSISS